MFYLKSINNYDEISYIYNIYISTYIGGSVHNWVEISIPRLINIDTGWEESNGFEWILFWIQSSIHKKIKLRMDNNLKEIVIPE